MPQKPLSIVLIHGLWMTPHSWKPFVKYYEALGYRVAAPAWPRLKGSIEDLRREPSVLAGLGVLEIADHYDRFIRQTCLAKSTPPLLRRRDVAGVPGRRHRGPLAGDSRPIADNVAQLRTARLLLRQRAAMPSERLRLFAHRRGREE